jgi:hypothetical protein
MMAAGSRPTAVRDYSSDFPCSDVLHEVSFGPSIDFRSFFA